jgi:pimeloyl-ACP methyl ester carboxylesterase
MAADTGEAAFLNQQRAIMSRPDSRPGLAVISRPALIMFARQDGIVTLAHQEEMHREIRNSRLEIVEDCGHLMTLERPQIISELLADWISAT